MQKTIDIFRTSLIFVICTLTALNAVTITLQVLFRFVFQISIAWVTEFAGVSLVWITFLGASLATLDQSNIGFDLVIEKLKPGPKFALKSLINLLILLVAYILLVYGYRTTLNGLRSVMPVLPVSYGACYSIIPVSGAFMGFAVFVNAARDFHTYRGVPVTANGGELYDDVPMEVMEEAISSFAKKEEPASKEAKKQ